MAFFSHYLCHILPLALHHFPQKSMAKRAMISPNIFMLLLGCYNCSVYIVIYSLNVTYFENEGIFAGYLQTCVCGRRGVLWFKKRTSNSNRTSSKCALVPHTENQILKMKTTSTFQCIKPRNTPTVGFHFLSIYTKLVSTFTFFRYTPSSFLLSLSLSFDIQQVGFYFHFQFLSIYAKSVFAVHYSIRISGVPRNFIS